MPIVRYPSLLKLMQPGLICRYPDCHKEVYLTFDDGPIPESTPWTLDLLKRMGVRATFFCVGDNVRKYPHLYERIVKEGHAVGNHTFNHLNGAFTSSSRYVDNACKAQEFIQTNLFRPPHGIIRWRQMRMLNGRYRMVMWDVLSADYRADITPEQCLDRVVKYSRPGSVIVFHNNIKSEVNMRYALPRAIEILRAEGYSFELCF